jgi:hypothetical protein
MQTVCFYFCSLLCHPNQTLRQTSERGGETVEMGENPGREGKETDETSGIAETDGTVTGEMKGETAET